jgi:hypothetical protein
VNQPISPEKKSAEQQRIDKQKKRGKTEGRHNIPGRWQTQTTEIARAKGIDDH